MTETKQQGDDSMSQPANIELDRRTGVRKTIDVIGFWLAIGIFITIPIVSAMFIMNPDSF